MRPLDLCFTGVRSNEYVFVIMCELTTYRGNYRLDLSGSQETNNLEEILNYKK